MWLEDPEFDLVSWYRCYLDQSGLFAQGYRNAHPELQQSGEKIATAPPEGHEESASSLPTKQETEWDNSPDLEGLSPCKIDIDGLFTGNLEEEVDFVDMPTLDPVTDDSDCEENEEGTWLNLLTYPQEDNRLFIEKMQTVLTQCQPYPGDGPPVDPYFEIGEA